MKPNKNKTISLTIVTVVRLTTLHTNKTNDDIQPRTTKKKKKTNKLSSKILKKIRTKPKTKKYLLIKWQ